MTGAFIHAGHGCASWVSAHKVSAAWVTITSANGHRVASAGRVGSQASGRVPDGRAPVKASQASGEVGRRRVFYPRLGDLASTSYISIMHRIYKFFKLLNLPASLRSPTTLPFLSVSRPGHVPPAVVKLFVGGRGFTWRVPRRQASRRLAIPWSCK